MPIEDFFEFQLRSDIRKQIREKKKDPSSIQEDKNSFYHIIELLVEEKANLNQVNISDGLTPLYLAAFAGDVPLITHLVNLKADPNFASKDERAPLFSAISNNKLDAVKELCRLKADVNAMIDEGMTPFHCAIHFKNLPIVQAMIEANADVFKPTKTGWSPLYVAVNQHVCNTFTSKEKEAMEQEKTA